MFKFSWFLLVTLFLGDLSGAVASIDNMQRQIDSKWSIPTRKRHSYELTPHERTKPIVLGDIIYVANLEGSISAIHRTGGRYLWGPITIPSKKSIEGAFAYARSKLYVGDSDGNLYAFNARDGSLAGQTKIAAQWLSAPIVVRDPASQRMLVIAASSNDEVYAFTEKLDAEVWSYSRRGDEKMTVRGTAAPVSYGELIYQGFSDGTLVALTISKGVESWTQRLRTRDNFYDIDMVASVDELSVIVGTFDGNVFSLNRLTGTKQWSFPVGSYGGFLVDNTRVYFSGLNGKFYGLSRETGQPVWSTPFAKGVGLTPVKAGEFLVFPTSGDPIYIIDPIDGKPVATYSLGAGTFADVAAHEDGSFYVISNYGNFHSFELRKTFAWKGPRVVASPSAIHRLDSKQRNKNAS